MKICAISPLENASKIEILKFIENNDADLIVLPGYSSNHPNHKEISKVLKKGAYVFMESDAEKLKAHPLLVSQDKHIKMPPQIFSQNPTSKQLDELQAVWTARTHKIKGHTFSFVICGEIDAFEKNGSVKRGRSLPYQILINPTHTPRGRWNHLGTKLENLSKGTILVHVANNTYNHHKVTTHLRIYVDGKVMTRYELDNISWSEYEIV